MKRVIAGLAAALSIAAISYGQTAPDLNDAVLVMYKLSAAQEAMFQPTSTTAVADFWKVWDDSNSAALTKDYVFMASDNPLYAWNRTAGITFAGHDDAQMTVRAAYGANGAYFYLLVEDNIWTPFTGWQTDCADMYFDIVPLSGMTSDIFFDPTASALSFNSKQLQMPYGALTPAQINFRQYSADAIGMVDNLVNNNDPTLDNMSVKVIQLDATHKIMEWYLPYSQWGLTGQPAANTQFCFLPGYNDVDDGIATDVKSLRWQDLCDPYCGVSTAPWGQIEAGPTLGGSDGIIKKLTRNVNLAKAPISTEMYTLRGDKISTSSSRVAGLVVKRELLANGVKTASMSLGR